MRLHYLLIASLLTVPLAACKTTQGKKGQFKYNGLPFESYDKDGDGFVSEAELDQRLIIAYNLMDINGDDNVDWSEFKTVGALGKIARDKQFEAAGKMKMSPTMKASLDASFDKNLEKRFKDLDKNNNKKITLNEFQKSKNNIKNNMMAADLDGDKKVSKVELETNTRLRMMQAISDIQQAMKSSEAQAKK